MIIECYHCKEKMELEDTQLIDLGRKQLAREIMEVLNEK